MSIQRKMSFNEKLKLFYQQHKLGKKSTLLDSTYEIKTYGPFDSNFVGIPSMHKYKIFAILAVVYFAMYWYIGDKLPFELFDFVIGFETYGIMTAWAIVIGLGLCGLGMWIYISLSFGTFANYKRIINAVVRYLDGRDAIPTEWRIRGQYEIWTPYMRKKPEPKEIAKPKKKKENKK